MNCPTHNVLLIAAPTGFGLRYNCPVNGCTVRWWPRRNKSTPCDAETAALWSQCHALFDPLWRRDGFGRRFFGAMARSDAYEWLAKAMRVKISKCHFGQFDAEQCKQAIKLIDQLAADAA